jgi:hypothetical protein
VAQERALRLQQLLAVKRHETPGSHYFDNFLDNFHRRLAAATAPQPTLWERICARFHLEPAPRLRYGFVHALGVVFALALIWQGLIASDLPVATSSDSTAPAFTNLPDPAPSSTPSVIASKLPASVLPPMHTLPAAPVVTRDFNSPRYILDRISLTPASYEVASIHF